MTDGTGTTTYGTDAMGDVTSQAFSAAQRHRGSARTRSATATSRPVSSATSLSQLRKLREPDRDLQLRPLGNMASETDWLGNEVTFSHDADGNLMAQDNDVSGGESERHQRHDLYLRQRGREHRGD